MIVHLKANDPTRRLCDGAPYTPPPKSADFVLCETCLHRLTILKRIERALERERRAP